MKKNWKSILLLMVMSVAFTELLTGNLTIVQLFNPVILLLLFTIGYGLPVLIIRELFIRWNMGLLSLILLGFAYGIWNEGVLAKTILLNENVPVETFEGYAGWLGINMAWAVVISVWHAFHAVLYPILIIHFLRKETSGKAWLSQNTFRWIVGLVLVFGSIFFMINNEHVVGTMPQLSLFLTVIALLTGIGYALRGVMRFSSGETKCIKSLWIYGVVFIFLELLVTAAMASSGLSGVGIVLFVSLLVFGVMRLLQKKGLSSHNIIIFGLGDYVLSGIFTIIFVGMGNSIVLITVLVLQTIFIVLLRKVYSSVIKK